MTRTARLYDALYLIYEIITSIITLQWRLLEELTTFYIITTKKQQIRISVKAAGWAVNHSVTVIIYATDILLTPLMIAAISVAVLVIPMSQHALRAILQTKIQLRAPTCVWRQQEQQHQQRHPQQRRLRQQRHWRQQLMASRRLKLTQQHVSVSAQK